MNVTASHSEARPPILSPWHLLGLAVGLGLIAVALTL
jgi:hypothetical protein